MSAIVIHGIPGSPYVRMPLLACEEKGVPYRLTAMQPGQHKAPEHLARHPFGRVPAMEHDGFRLYEAQAIVRYIDDAFDGPALTPTEPKARARMSQVMNILDWYAMPSLTAGASFNRVVAPIFGRPVDEAKVAESLQPGAVCLAALEEILGDQAYFTGGQVSLADLMAVSHLDFLPLYAEGRELLKAAPRVAAWLDRMAGRPSVQKTGFRKLMGLDERTPEPA